MDLFSRIQPVAPTSLSVTQLVRRMKNLVELQIGSVWVEGEVSNLKKQGSGHWYFSLKDEGAQIQCAMFDARRKLGATSLGGAAVLEDGARVRAFAEASIYEARGQLQIIVQKVEPAGLGALKVRFDALKAKLTAEGIFDRARKLPLPIFPRVIGIVTSETGAVIRDILNVLQRRAPWVQPVLFPVRVQGRGAEIEIANAIKQLGSGTATGLGSLIKCDLLIVGRGGGSLEDLWAFNEEIVARAISACPIPVISAVGHEVDFTIADFVADLRAPTPSAAAELAVPDGAELLTGLAKSRRRLARLTIDQLSLAKMRVESLRRGALQRDGARLLREPTMRLDSASMRLERAMKSALTTAAARVSEARTLHRAHHPARMLERRAEHLERLRARLKRIGTGSLHQHEVRIARLRDLLRTLGPDFAFQRGFSITLDAHGKIIRSASAVKPGDLLHTKFADGDITSAATGRAMK